MIRRFITQHAGKRGMPTLSAAVVEGDRATFVEAIVRANRPHRVRLEPRFRGVIWPPRIEGRLAAGWDEHGLTTTVGVGATGVGFATPVSPDGEPVSIVRSEPLSEELPVGITAWLDRIEGGCRSTCCHRDGGVGRRTRRGRATRGRTRPGPATRGPALDRSEPTTNEVGDGRNTDG